MSSNSENKRLLRVFQEIQDTADKTGNPLGNRFKSSYLEDSDEIAREYAHQHNLKVLTNGQSGSLSIEQMDGKKAFWAGNAHQCVAAAIIHPSVGISAAHFNTLSTRKFFEDWQKQLGETLGLIDRDLEGIQREGLKYVIRRFVPIEKRFNTVIETLSEALLEFNATSSVPIAQLKDISAVITGVVYGTEMETSILQVAVIESLRTTGLDINLESHLGQPGGAVYGGPNHPLFQQTRIISL